jgi:hypothetical protein
MAKYRYFPTSLTIVSVTHAFLLYTPSTNNSFNPALPFNPQFIPLNHRFLPFRVKPGTNPITFAIIGLMANPLIASTDKGG